MNITSHHLRSVGEIMSDGVMLLYIMYGGMMVTGALAWQLRSSHTGLTVSLINHGFTPGLLMP